MFYLFKYICHSHLMNKLNDIQNQKDGVSYVLVFKLSRFGRNAADVLNSLQITGHECSFRQSIEQTEINRMVASIISVILNKPQFFEAIKEKIGTSVDTKELENQISVMQGQIKQAIGIKNRLERQMDTLDIDDPHFDRNLTDLQRRYDEQYDIIAEIEAQMEDVQNKILRIHQKKNID